MGRRKVQIKRIQDDRARKVTFAKRKFGLVKKAMELSLLCDCDIALLIFTKEKPDQRFFQYTTTSMQSILNKLAKNPKPVEDRHNGQYFDLYEKKGAKPVDDGSITWDGDEGNENVALPNSMPVRYLEKKPTSSNKRRRLTVDTSKSSEIAAPDVDRLTPNSMALFQQLGTSLAGPVVSPNHMGDLPLGDLDPLGEDAAGDAVEPSPNTLAAFGGLMAMEPSVDGNEEPSSEE